MFLIIVYPVDNTVKDARQPGALQGALRHGAWEPTRVWPSGKTPQLRKYPANVTSEPAPPSIDSKGMTSL